MSSITKQRFEGFVDVATASHIAGWATDVSSPDDPVWISIQIGEKEVARVQCGTARADAVAAGYAGARAFFFEPRAYFSDGPNEVTARFAATGEVLRNGRVSVDVDVSAQIGDYWSGMYRAPSALYTRWWQCEMIVRHINERVCGKPLDGLSSGLYELARQKLGDRLPLGHGISVGCGDGSKELRALQSGIAERFTLYEFSSYGIESGRASAERAGVASRMTFVHGDAFDRERGEGIYDLVFWNNSLHHMMDAEQAVAWSWRVLRDGGVLLMDDYVGPTRMQWSDRLLEINTRYRESLPEQYLRDPANPNTMLGRTVTRIPVAHFEATDPSECADAAQILPSLRRWFPEMELIFTGGGIYHLGLNDVLHNILMAGDMMEIERALRLDDACIELGETQYAVAIATKRAATAP